MREIKIGDIVKKTWQGDCYIIGMVTRIIDDFPSNNHTNYKLKVYRRKGVLYEVISSEGEIEILDEKTAVLEVL